MMRSIVGVDRSVERFKIFKWERRSLRIKKVFLIDGFNFYYSIVRVQQDSNIKAKWFNYRALCEFYKNDFQSKKQKLSKSLEKYF
jgi:hypothetical protein